MDIEMLINEVYQRPVLWDISTDDYKNKDKKTTAVFQDMNMKTITVQVNWR
jgi:hypothetical protein